MKHVRLLLDKPINYFDSVTQLVAERDSRQIVYRGYDEFLSPLVVADLRLVSGCRRCGRQHFGRL